MNPSNTIVRKAKNGYTIIYEHNPNYKGDDVTVGFLGGSSFDGNYPGLAHLIEHLSLRAESDEIQNIYNEFFKANLSNINGVTNDAAILLTFSTSEQKFQMALSNITKMFLNKNFTKEQIDKELDIIASESKIRNEYSDSTQSINHGANLTLKNEYFASELIGFLKYGGTVRKTNSEIIGSVDELKKKLTPKILAEYKERYFKKENLVISIVTNKSINEVEDICDEVFAPIPRVSKQEYIFKLPILGSYQRANLGIKSIEPKSSNVELCFFLRERTLDSIDICFEKACDMIEENYLCGIGNLLHQKFRLENQLTYTSDFRNCDLGTSKFKIFIAVANKNNMNNVIKILMKDVIGNIAKNGIEKHSFDLIKNKLVENIDNVIFDNPNSSFTNCFTYSNGVPFVKVKKIREALRNLEYDKFNEYIKKVYSINNISYAINGDFDEKQVPSLVDLQNMTGIRKRELASQKTVNAENMIIESLPILNEDLLPHERDFWEAIDYFGTQK